MGVGAPLRDVTAETKWRHENREDSQVLRTKSIYSTKQAGSAI